ncbi:MAG: hypothetical protein KIH09_17465, partial [Candidatus Freyarchaeota archaeon]|nr:hypothetical protein [Candidatus Jordarchaeia archaeon]
DVTTIVGKYRIQYYLTIRTAPSGIATIEGEGWYYESTQVTIGAPIVPNYKFQYWDIDSVPQSSEINPITIQMNAPHALTAHYAQIPTYTLTIIATEGGTTDPSPGTYTYPEGFLVHVRAIPKTGYIFSHWELDGINVGSITITTVIMNNNHVLRAVFAAAPRGWFIPCWFFLPLLLILVLIIILIAILIYRRARKRKIEAFNSGWVAWYYHHNLYRRTLK